MNTPRQGAQVNTMVSDHYEIYRVKDVVSQQKTIYHSHDFYEIHATLEGEATFYLDGKQFTIQAGTVLLIHYHDLHRIVKQSTEVFERVYTFLTPSFLASRSTSFSNLEECFQPFGERKSLILQVDPEILQQQLEFSKTSPAKEVYGDDILYEQKLVDYLIFLNRVVQNMVNDDHPKALVQNERIEKMIQYISRNLSNPLTLEEMEKHFFVSKYYITREFKKHTGTTFHQYVMKKKLIYAKQLLREYRSSSAVYSKCGFVSYPHFLKVFKKEFGLTPKEFLKRDAKKELIHYHHFEEEVLTPERFPKQ